MSGPLAAFPAGQRAPVPPPVLPAAREDAEIAMASALYAAFVGHDLAQRLPLVNNPAPIRRRWLAMARVAIRVAPTLAEIAP